MLQTSKPEADSLASSAANLNKALASFKASQLAPATEMSIILPSSGQGLTVALPPVTSSIDMAGQLSRSRLRASPPGLPLRTTRSFSL